MINSCFKSPSLWELRVVAANVLTGLGVKQRELEEVCCSKRKLTSVSIPTLSLINRLIHSTGAMC